MQLSLPFEVSIQGTSPSILQRIKTCHSLPVLPPLASKIVKMCQSEDATATDLAQLISHDPSMMAQILFMANSGYYSGSRHKVTSAIQAVTLLGFSTIANLALSFCFYRLIQDLRSTSPSGLDQVGFWRRSIFAGVAGRALGLHFAHPDPELVFVGSLLQDIGILALNEVARDETALMYSTSGNNHTALHRLELEQIGVDHPQVGAWLAQQWQLPEEFQVAILYSHRPELLETPKEWQLMVDCVALSGFIADIWTSSNSEVALKTAKAQACGRLTVKPESWGSLLHYIHSALPQIAGFFHTRLGNWEDISHTYHLAVKYLAPAHPHLP
jgi:HD-like signal output (HDOD) protein